MLHKITWRTTTGLQALSRLVVEDHRKLLTWLQQTQAGLELTLGKLQPFFIHAGADVNHIHKRLTNALDVHETCVAIATDSANPGCTASFGGLNQRTSAAGFASRCTTKWLTASDQRGKIA